MSKSFHIMVVDDDAEIRDLLSQFLQKHGFRVTTAKNANELFNLLKKNEDVDLIVLDIMMPGMDGIEACRKLRESSSIPTIMLTAVNEETDRIITLELGADDYLAKPFNPRELLARIKAVLRRSHDIDDNGNQTKAIIYEFDGWKLDVASRRLVNPEAVEVALSAGTYDLLLAFLERPQRMLNRDQLMDITKNRTADAFDRSIDVQISRLRHKIELDPKNPQLIKTVRSGGYMLACEVSKQKKSLNTNT